jgi:hypothetical protein
MKFKADPVTSLEDATLNFEQLQTLDILNLTAESVLQLAVTGTRRRVAFGSQSLTFSASVSATPATVTHGLGVTPIAVVATPVIATSTTVVAAYVASLGASSFVLNSTASVALTGSQSYLWIAIG